MKASEEMRKLIDIMVETGKENWFQWVQPKGPEKLCLIMRAAKNDILTYPYIEKLYLTSNRAKVDRVIENLGFESIVELNDTADSFEHMLMRAEMVYNLLVKEGN
jgi:hypothetical protein